MSDEIDRESDDIFIDIKYKIDKLNKCIFENTNELNQVVIEIENRVEVLVVKYHKELSDIETEIAYIKGIKITHLKVKSYFEELGIKDNDFEDYHKILIEKINKLLITEDIEYYTLKYNEIEDRINQINASLNKYIDYKIKYKVNELEEALKYINIYNADIAKYEDTVSLSEKIIRISEELIGYYNYYFSKNQLVQLNQSLDIYEKKAKILSNIENTYFNIDKNSRNIVELQTRRILTTYEATIRRIYKYLNPNLKFNEFNFKIDSSNPKNNRMILEVVGLNGSKMNPAYSFSSAQNNVLAISIFLSFALTQKWSGLNSIFMDDPIQNMDDININNFVDVLRNVINKTDKQIFISTHDERIYNFIKNKTQSYVQSFEFQDYGKIKSGM